MIEKLNKICETKEEFDLTKYNTYRLNSISKCVVFPSNIDELKEVLNVVKDYKHMILGNGSNVILPPYYDGVIIKLDKFNGCELHDDYVYAECGYMINKLSMDLVEKGYSGLEWANGIPGTIGGCVYNNAGAYNSSISEILISATIYDGKEIIELNNEEMNFSYRDSILKHNKNLILLSCKLKIVSADKEELKQIVNDRTQKRLQTQDLSHPSCGSVFRNPEGVAAGKLIDDLGLKGLNINGAMVSKIHANFIINDDNATQEDIVNLINKIKKDVKDTYDIDLVLEQEIIE
ncbi:MAG: UDP-N-acetylmuramate dehydrogenase [Bacilli bacterium]|nr:UDP-N-acetylmuramate dehydrogenase [Bacilli bacterium]